MLKIALVLAFCLQLVACARSGAPTFIFFGAYFPAWLLCLFLGAFGALLSRVILAHLGLYQDLPYRTLVYLALGIIVGSSTWLFVFN